MSEIRPGSQVTYKANPSEAGLLIDTVGDSARVFIGGSMRLVPVSDLEPIPVAVPISPADFRNALTKRRLEHPLTDQFLSYRASRTDLYYHQFLPVKKMLESSDQRLLIADEVGTGKTISAGLIWAELESRAAHGLDNVLIVCPKSLLEKWRDEMLQRFDFRLEILTPDSLRQALVALNRDGILPPRFAKSIVNLELLRSRGNLENLNESSITWDLAIFDEAHHLRNPETQSHRLAALVCERSTSAVFLTATPLQTSLYDIVHLMEALGVDVAEDPDLLEEQMVWDMDMNDWIRLVRNRPPNWQEAASQALQQLEASGGKERPGWEQFQRLASASDLDDRSQRTIVVQAAKDLQTLSPYMTRTLRSDVDKNRPTREAVTRPVKFSGEEEAFYQEVYRVCAERAEADDLPPAFVTQMPERRTSSCLPAMVSEVLRGGDEDEDEEDRARFTRSELARLLPLAEAARQSKDLKLEMLCETLKSAFGDLNTDRAIIFSTFRGTLHYLADELRKRGYSLELMYGPTPARDEDCRPGQKSRQRIESEFRRGEFQILLASEVAGEGLDFEHCHVLINYDLPWNPMRVEQRIGRCDRIGQRSDKVYIRNLVSVGTIEERILSRLYDRLGIFERALGDMEVILGERISVFEQDVFSRGLTRAEAEERIERISQIVENSARQREDVTSSSVISQQGRQIIESDQQEIKDAESRFLSMSEISEFVYAALESNLPNSVRRTLNSGDGFTVRNTQELKDALASLVSAYRSTSPARMDITQFRNRIEIQRTTHVSFSERADDIEFAHVRHPLVSLARHLTREQDAGALYCEGAISTATLDKPTAIVWAIGSLEGHTNRAEILCAAVNCDTGESRPITVAQAQEITRALAPMPDGQPKLGEDVQVLEAKAESTLIAEFDKIRSAFDSKNAALIEQEKRATVSLAKRKVEKNNRQLAKDDLDQNLRNMYLGWNRNIQSDAESKLADIDRRSLAKSSMEIIGVAVAHPQR